MPEAFIGRRGGGGKLERGAATPVTGWWLASAVASLVACALWLRTPWIPYASAAILATAATGWLTWRRAAGRWGWVCVVAAAVSGAISVSAERDLAGMRNDPTNFDRRLQDAGFEALSRDVRVAAQELRRVAASGLRVPGDSIGIFDGVKRALPDPNGRAGEAGIVLFENGAAAAWAGTVRLSPEGMRDSLGVTAANFYTVLYASAERGSRRVVAMRLLHAEPPADGLARPLDRRVANAMGLGGYEFSPVARTDAGWRALEIAPGLRIGMRSLLRVPGAARQRVVERALLQGALALAVALIAFLGIVWQHPASLARRIVALGAGLVVVALVPLPALSNVARLFDPTVYYASFGGPFTANAGALALTSALALLGFFAIQRSGRRLMGRGPAAVAVLAIAALGPFLLRDLSRGISPPPLGVTVSLWISWQIALFLAASATLLAGASAGTIALGARRGLNPAVGPIIASLAAVAAPLLWQAPGNWPGWYPLPWIAAMAALALVRRSRATVVSAAIVAACGATTLVWGATARKRVELAERDVARLSSPDSTALQLLERFSRSLAISTPPVEREELLQRYVRSDLAAGGYPAALASWLPGATQPYAELVVAAFEHQREGERALVAEARSLGKALLRVDSTSFGVQLVLAVPHDNEDVTTVVVAPRTLLIPNDPYMSLIGLGAGSDLEPPYDVTLTQLDAPSPLPLVPRWQRKGSELHGDARVGAADRPARVHLEVDLRGLDALIPRGALIVLLDLAALSVLWTLAAAADGGLGRWLRSRLRGYSRSYRARLTVTLFSFFTLPAIVFAWWSYARLQTTDRQSRELLVRETLRAIEATGDPVALAYESARLKTPLFLYSGGELRASSDPLYDRLSSVGRFLPPPVALRLTGEDEVDASERVRIGDRPVLFGYRAILGFGEGSGTVLAAPARVNEFVLDRQRRDLGTLVLFATALGAVAALWLSGLAARELGRPIGALREAALRIARGGRHPDMPDPPPSEFTPVFSAFRRMDDDLAASRDALEEAQRRTEAVLRNVASGVFAVSLDGRITIANRRAEALLGRTLSAETSLEDLGVPELAREVRRFLPGDAGDASFDLELRGRQVRGSLTRLTRGAGGVVVTLDDVTELARAQRVLAWGEMARQVAHEIKNPLTPIRLGVQHLRRAHADRRVEFERVFEQNVTRILQEIDRLDEIARSFSQYGMAPADRLPGEGIDVAHVARDVMELEQMGESDLDWGISGAEGPVLAIARKDELREVLLNVLENARQARARSVRLELLRDRNHIHLVVCDDGSGIPEEVLPRIFEPHFSTRTSGSGLGLAISRGLVRGWGGDMTVSSPPGRGTEVRITLVAAGDQ